MAYTPEQVKDAYARVNDQIAQAAARSGRQREEILLVAVTKYAAPEQIKALLETGQRDLGESRVQQLVDRAPEITRMLTPEGRLAHVLNRTQDGERQPARPADPVRWHMVGHLQRNKVRQVAPLVRLIHSVDSLKLAEELHAAGAQFGQPIEILLQVNAGEDANKHGVALPAALHVAEQIDTMVNVRLRGLMTMAPLSDDPDVARSAFSRCAELFYEVRNADIGGQAFNILSMGMSGDFEIAIEEGANCVRIGRALFGDA